MSSEKILLVDDHEIVRAGFRSLLGAGSDFTVLEAGSAEDGYAMFLQEKPDVVIMDINMPGMGGIEAIRRILAQDASARIIVLSMYDDPSHIENTRRMGVMGYVTKRSAPDELLEAINTVLQGKKYLSDDLEVSSSLRTAPPAEIFALSQREFEIFTLLAGGMSANEIAEHLHISPKTVSNHRDHIMAKLQLKNIAELTRFAIRHGVIDA